MKNGDTKEVDKFKSRSVYDYAPRAETSEGKLVKTRWDRTAKGT